MTHRSFQAQRSHYHNHYVEEEVKKVVERYTTPTCVRINVHYLYLHDWAQNDSNDDSVIMLLE